MKITSGRRRVLTFVVAGLFVFAGLLTAFINPAHGYTNAIPTFCNSSNITAGTQISPFNFGCTSAAEVSLGLLVVVCDTLGGATLVTDSSGNNWQSIVANSNTPGAGNTVVVTAPNIASNNPPPETMGLQIWFTQLKASTPSTDSMTVNIRYGDCWADTFVSDTTAIYFIRSGSSSLSDTACGVSLLPSCGQANNLAIVQRLPVAPVGGMVFGIGLTYDKAATSSEPLLNGLTRIRGVGWSGVTGATTPYNVDEVHWVTSGFYFANGGGGSGSGATGVFTNTSNSLRLYAVFVVQFGPVGGKTNCADCTVVDGGNTPTTSTSALTANQTFLYTDTTLNGELLFQNITTRLSSVTLTNGQTSTTLELGLYEVGSQSSSASANLAPVTSTNLLNRIAFADFTITTTASAKSYSFNPNVTVWNGTTYAIVISIHHTGANIFQASTTATMQTDTTDGYAPAFIGTFASSSPAFYIASQSWIQVIVTSVTLTTQTASTVLVTSTATINQPNQASAGNWMTPTMFIFLFIALFCGIPELAGLKGPITIFLMEFGAAIGMTMGTFGQLVPMQFTIIGWLAFFFSIFSVTRD